MKKRHIVIVIISLVCIIVAVFLILVLLNHKSVPQTYSSVRNLAPLPNSEQKSIQSALDNFWREYSLENNSQSEVKDSTLVPKSESVNLANNEEKPTTETTETKILYPGIPEGLVTAPVSSTSIKLSWNPAKYASTYNVYRSTNRERGYHKLANVKSTQYVDTALNPGTTYFYKVSSLKSSGIESYFPNPVGTATHALDAPASSQEGDKSQ